MHQRGWKSTASYAGWLAAALAVAMVGSWIFGPQVDDAVYDAMFRIYQPNPWQPESALLVFDDRTLDAIPAGRDGYREPLTKLLRLLAPAKPLSVTVDILLVTARDSATDARLAEAIRDTPNVVLASQVLADGWQDPLPIFRDAAKGVGHVQAQESHIPVARWIPLEQRSGPQRRWALALEAFHLSRNSAIAESTASRDLQIGDIRIPATGKDRLMRVRFTPREVRRTVIPVKRLLDEPALTSEFTGKAVFIGVTAAVEHDGLTTPYGYLSGIAINADAYETIAHQMFLTDVSDLWEVLLAMSFVAAAGLAFRYFPGWIAIAACIVILIVAQALPYVFFTHQRVLSFATPVSAAWLGSLTAFAYYYLVVRRNLGRSEAERTRYQQAMHFVTHEMRTPLSAIQGSSELISKYALTEDKRKQLSLLINSESKRLARMVEIFLNVERLSAGQMELKREPISVKEMVEMCVTRAAPLAERKHIGVTLQPITEELQITGDRELMEYACYNLLTNAVKYSPQRTEVTVTSVREGSHVRIAVKDQGIGMDQKEVRQIFRKFYRTKKAEESGEAGTGIGLSIVQQIVEQHEGRIEVTSQPGDGSCFTLVLPAAARAAVTVAAERR